MDAQMINPARDMLRPEKLPHFFCSGCGRELSPDEDFCCACGTKRPVIKESGYTEQDDYINL